MPTTGGPLATLSDQVPPLKLLIQEQDCRELERAINIRETIAMAEEEASSVADENVSDEPVDPDWFARWRVNAEEVHDDKMRQLWARILAGEAEKPGRFSLHTLDFVRRLSKDDAALIERLAPFVADRAVFRGDPRLDGLLKSNRLDIGTLTELQDLGVASNVEAIGLSRSYTLSSDVYLRYWNKALVVRPSEATLFLHAYGITKVGAQVMSPGKFQANNDFVLAVGQIILEKGFEVWMGDAVESTDAPNHYLVVNAQQLLRRA